MNRETMEKIKKYLYRELETDNTNVEINELLDELENNKGDMATDKELKAKEAMSHIYRLITEANTLNDMGDTYIPEEEIINYLKEIL